MSLELACRFPENVWEHRSRTALLNTDCSADCIFSRLAFYNIGWNKNSKKPYHSADCLANEIWTIVKRNKVHAIGICEVFGLNDDSDADRKRRKSIMNHLLHVRRDGSGCAWEGKCDAHNIFLWNTPKLLMVDYEVVSCGIEKQPWRRAQHFKFRCAESEKERCLHIYHNHNPTTNLTRQRKKDIVVALWGHLRANCMDEEPAVVFGGDFNCKMEQWRECLSNLENMHAHWRNVCVCASETEREITPGDRAVAFNVYAYQESSKWGKNYNAAAFSDAHDVVLVPFWWGNAEKCSADNRSHQPETHVRTDSGEFLQVRERPKRVRRWNRTESGA